MAKPCTYDESNKLPCTHYASNKLQWIYIYRNTVWVLGHIILTGTHLDNVRIPLCNMWVTQQYQRCVDNFEVCHPRCVSNKLNSNMYAYIVKHNYISDCMLIYV
jgi:hypothetical protein